MKLSRIRIVILLLLFSSFKISLYGQEEERKVILKKIEEAERTLPEYEKDTNYLINLNKAANYYRFIKKDSLLFYAEKSLKLCKQANYVSGHIDALKYVGDYHCDSGDHENAVKYYNEGIQLAKEHNRIRSQLVLTNNLALQYHFNNNAAKALELFMEAIDIAKSNNDYEMQAIFTENVAVIYIDEHDNELALEFYEKVLQLHKIIGNEHMNARTICNLGSLYIDLKEYEKALFYTDKAIAYFEKNKVDEWLVYAYTVKGRIFLNQEKFKSAINWFDKAETVNIGVEDEREKARLYHGYATAYFGLGDYDSSKDYAQRCYDISTKMNWISGLNLGAEALYMVYKQKNNAEQALAFHEIYHSTSDSISRKENQQSLALLKTRVQYERQKETLIAENEKALEQQQNYIYLSIGIVILVLSVLIPLYFNKKRLANLYGQLQTKTEELKARQIELKKMDRTKNQLFSIIGHDLRGPIGGLQGLLTLFVNKELPAEQFNKFIPKLKADVDHILFSLNNLLSWGQAQMKHEVTKPSIVGVKNSAEDGIKLLNESASKKGIRLINKIPDLATVWVDNNHLDLIFRNLLSNAIKFTPENGTITLGAFDEGKYWKMEVRDTGIGMKKEVIRKIFSEDEKITTFGTNNEKGTGLGLSLCQEMVERNKGKIWVESELQIGSTFYFTIPKSREKQLKEAV